MGNRAVITSEGSEVGIYLHWNGGVESVLAFLEAAKQLGLRGINDPEYSYARLTQVIGNFFGGTTSLGFGIIDALDTDNGDNGTYYINDKWEITKRTHTAYTEKTVADLNPDQKLYYDGVLNQVLENNQYAFNTKPVNQPEVLNIPLRHDQPITDAKTGETAQEFYS